MREKNYIYDPEEQTMVFSVDTKRHVRVAYCDGQVWYAIRDVAKLLNYRAPGKAANFQDYGVRLLRVPHTSVNVRGNTNCNCISKDALLRFIKMQHDDKEICDWIRFTVIPQAERQFMGEVLREPEPETPKHISITNTYPATRVTELLDKLDQFIVAAVTFRQEIQHK